MTAAYCLGTGVPGTGNLEVDPKLRPDGHLCSDSPCINAGDPAYTAGTGEKDIDGEARTVAGRVDIGVDEFTDADSDGLPDWWESKYFDSPTAGVASADSDGDGVNNLAEYNRGTNPLMATPDYYVDPVGGNDAWDGFAQAWNGTHGPKKTIQAAVDAALPLEGGRILLAAGTYTGAGNHDVEFKGKPVTIISQVPGAAIIDCQGTQSEPHTGIPVPVRGRGQ